MNAHRPWIPEIEPIYALIESVFDCIDQWIESDTELNFEIKLVKK